MSELRTKNPPQELCALPLPAISDVPRLEPGETQTLPISKHFLFRSEITAAAVSTSSSYFALGTKSGAVSIWSTLTLCVRQGAPPCHYAAVSQIAFSGNTRCLTVGEDGWVHCLSVETGAVVFRSNMNPALDPGLSVLACAGGSSRGFSHMYF